MTCQKNSNSQRILPPIRTYYNVPFQKKSEVTFLRIPYLSVGYISARREILG